MQLLARAEVLVVNGLGLEEFLGAPIKKANPAIQLIDSSKGVDDLILDSTEEGQGQDQHGHQGMNPHLFVSPRLTAELTRYIASELAKIDPEGRDVYTANGQAYAAKMMGLDQEMVALSKRLVNKRIITQHGVFDYLARDMGLEVVAVVAAHAGQEPSAAEMLAIIKTAKAKRAGGIFSEPQYSAKVVATIAQEVGIPAATLDPVATGPDDAGLDYYEQVMAKNRQTLQSTLGVQ
jgi:ABC-type Zn uptake system ZnuABC Zn-binding protein ZnuA